MTNVDFEVKELGCKCYYICANSNRPQQSPLARGHRCTIGHDMGDAWLQNTHSHTYMQKHEHTCANTYERTFNTQEHTLINQNTQTQRHRHTHPHTPTHPHTHAHAPTCIHACTHACTHRYVQAHALTHRHEIMHATSPNTCILRQGDGADGWVDYFIKMLHTLGIDAQAIAPVAWRVSTDCSGLDACIVGLKIARPRDSASANHDHMRHKHLARTCVLTSGFR